jgi:glycosyltransferase involved in cell wall biosynthesis
VFPSSTETLGLVLLEAMAAGCPVVGANRGGIPDIVTDGVNGRLYEPNQPASLITAVQRLLGDQASRSELRQSARLEAERWGCAGATAQLRGYYRQVLERRPLVMAA